MSPWRRPLPAPSPPICMIGQRARRPRRPVGRDGPSLPAPSGLFCFNYLAGPAGALVARRAIPDRCWTPAIAHNRRPALTAKALSIYPATLYEGAARRAATIRDYRRALPVAVASLPSLPSPLPPWLVELARLLSYIPPLQFPLARLGENARRPAIPVTTAAGRSPRTPAQ